MIIKNVEVLETRHISCIQIIYYSIYCNVATAFKYVTCGGDCP